MPLSKQKAKTFNNDNPLEMVEHETTKAHQALFDYAQMGMGRSLRKLIARYQLQEQEWTSFKNNPKGWPQDKPIPEPIPSKSWTVISGWSGKFLWQERVIRFDEIEREREALEFQNDRAKWSRRRKEFANAFFNKSVMALNALNMSKQELGDVTRAFKTALEEIRNEYGDDKGATPKGRIKLVEVVLAENGNIDVNVHGNKSDDEDED